LRHAAAPLNLDIRNFLRDPHWQMREAAIQALISLGQEETHELYEYYLKSQDDSVRQQIAEVIHRTGLMAALVEDYSAGTKGVNALMVEELASHVAPMGLSGILRNLDLEIRQKFLERFLPIAQSRMMLSNNGQSRLGRANSLQQALEFPPHLAA
jgi:HEAT repeat protein